MGAPAGRPSDALQGPMFITPDLKQGNFCPWETPLPPSCDGCRSVFPAVSAPHLHAVALVVGIAQLWVGVAVASQGIAGIKVNQHAPPSQHHVSPWRDEPVGREPLVLPVLLILQRDLAAHQSDEDVQVLLAAGAT